MPKRKPPGERKEKAKLSATKKPRVTEEITKSKALAAKLNEKPRNTTSKSKKSKEPRLFGNGKPMPSLAELERMYADSDEETLSEPVRPTTPATDHLKPPDIIVSPTKLKEIADKVLDVLEVVLPDPIIIIEDDVSSQPIIPPKKRKKNGIPYIVGCTERDKIESTPALTCFRGDKDFGVKRSHQSEDENEDDEGDCKSSKRKKRSEKNQYTKSIFNAKSDDIATILTNAENDGSSNDSNKTVAYQLYNPVDRFSPIPSTSNDDITIQKNEELFNQSVCTVKESNSLNDENLQGNDVEVIETPMETIEIDDNAMSDVQIKQDPDITDNPDSPIEIIKCHNEIKKLDSPINVDDCYGSIDLDFNYQDKTDEIIDVDAIIEENKQIIEKISEKSKSSKPVIHIAPNAIFQPIVSSVQDLPQPGPSTCSPSQPSTEIETIVANYFNNTGSDCSETFTDNSLKLSTATNVTPTHTTSTPNNHNMRNEPPIDLTAWTPVKDFFQKLNSDIRNWLNTVTPPRNNPSTVTPRNCPCYSQPTVTDYVVLNDSTQSTCRSADNSVQFVGMTAAPQRPNLNINNSVQILSPYMIGTNSPETQTCSGRTTSDNFADNRRGPGMSGPSILNGVNRKRCSTRSVKKLASNKALQKSSPCSPALEQSSNNDSGIQGVGDCPICMEKLTRNAIVSTLCGHLFCMDCMKAAIRTNGKKCPTCRKALKGVGYHQIFF